MLNAFLTYQLPDHWQHSMLPHMCQQRNDVRDSLPAACCIIIASPCDLTEAAARLCVRSSGIIRDRNCLPDRQACFDHL